MSVNKKHLGRGRWAVLQDGVQVAGPMDKTAAEAEASRLVAEAKPRTTEDASRAYWKRLNADLAAPLKEELADIKIVLQKRRTEDEVRALMIRLEPVLKAGKYGRIRSRRQNLLPAPAKAA